MKNGDGVAFFGLLVAIFLIVFIGSAFFNQLNECNAHGGAFVKGAFWYVCVRTAH